jgi:2-polyprenyl-3-methyl-5-hydroxy-6-metoxy-1,4-benzoquinol methylase
MTFYQNRILPHVIDLAMRQRNLAAYRHRVVSSAEGRVLEIGIGSGLNLPFYTQKAGLVIGLDPSPNLLAMARRAEHPTSSPVEFVEGSAEAIPLENKSIDTVVTTWTLCSIPTPHVHSARCVACSGPTDVSSSSNTAVLPIRACVGDKIALRRFGNVSAAAVISIARLEC